MNYKCWDIVLIPFPFTNLKITKKRPGLIITSEIYHKQNDDVIIAFMTSKINSTKRIGDYHLEEWQKAKLPKPTMLRMKYATISSSIIVKRLGTLHKNDIKGFSTEFCDFFKNVIRPNLT